jgi:hypothetical protein
MRLMDRSSPVEDRYIRNPTIPRTTAMNEMSLFLIIRPPRAGFADGPGALPAPFALPPPPTDPDRRRRADRVRG